MEHWKRIIEAGNRHFHGGDWVEAREAYLQALAEVQLLFDRWPDAEAVVAAFVVSHHNLADLHLQIDQPEEAAESLHHCHERLLQMIGDERLSPCLRAAAMHHSRHSYRELARFVQLHATQRYSGRLLDLLAVGPALAGHNPELRRRHYH